MDEQSPGIAIPVPPELPTDRRANGDFAKGNTLARRGGLAKKGKTHLASKIKLGKSFKDPRFAPYVHAANLWRAQQLTHLARNVGGGHCGNGPASILSSAALQLAGSRFAFEVLGDLALGSKLADASRQNVLASHELCVLEAKARPAPAAQVPWLVAAGNDAEEDDTQAGDEEKAGDP